MLTFKYGIGTIVNIWKSIFGKILTFNIFSCGIGGMVYARFKIVQEKILTNAMGFKNKNEILSSEIEFLDLTNTNTRV